MRLVLDTNTIISGFLWKGPPHRLLNVAKTRRDITLHTSPKLLAQPADVLSRDKLAAAVAATRRLPDALMRQYLDIAQVVTPATIVPVIPADSECIRRVWQKPALGAPANPGTWFFAFAVQFIKCSMH